MPQKLFEKIKQDVAKSPHKKKEHGKHSRYTVNNPRCRTILVHDIPFIFTCDQTDKLRYFQNHSIIIKDDEIVDVLPAAKVKKRDFDLIYNAGKRGGTVVMPGLINAHAHPPMYLMRSSMDLDEEENIDGTIAKFPLWERAMTEKDYMLSVIGDFTEQQKYGATTTLSHHNSFDPIEHAAFLTQQNVVNAISVASLVNPENSPELIEKILKESPNSFSKLAIAVHYLYKAKGSVLKKVQKLISENDLLFTCHMAESEQVVKETIKRHGKNEVGTLEKFGLLNKNTLLSHSIHVGKKDIEKLARAEVGIVHLPTSNRIHKSGIFPYWEYHDAGGFRNIALGTDSVVSKSRLDVSTEAYRARTTHLYRRTIKFGSLFKMMTINGAKVLHEPKRGRILPGHKADLVFWKLKDRGFIPYDKSNPFTLLGNSITHSGRVARDVMIGGKFVIKNRKHQLVDESKLLAVLQDRHMKMRKRVEKQA